MEKELTFGEKACGVSFNPGGNPLVNELKNEYAKLVTRLNQLRESSTDGEEKRMLSIAITESQTAQMWAVKAVTWNK
jgi:hypothetical protein